MNCQHCKDLGILTSPTKNTKCAYCYYSENSIEELQRKANLYDQFLKEAESAGYSGIGDLLDSSVVWREIAERQAQNTLDLQNKLYKIIEKLSNQEHYIGDKIHYGAKKIDDYRCFHVELYIPQKLNSSKNFKTCLEDWLGIE